MNDLKQKLMMEQLDTKLQLFVPLYNNPVPERGWLTAIRTTLKMLFRQFGNRMKITPQACNGLEKREREKSITL